jgi:hypothetical protein
MAKQADDRKTTRGPLLSLLLILIVLLLAWFLFSRPPSGHRQVDSGVALPDGAQPCEQKSASSKGFKFTCPIEGSSNTLGVANVPDGVTPYLVPISPEDEDEFKNAPLDGFNCPVTILGNVVFASDETKNLVTIFKSPIELKIDTPPASAQAASDCSPADNEVLVPIPVFLYSFNNEETNFMVWKPFQDYDSGTDTTAINFKVWGDPPIGISFLSTPKEWGPP